MTQVYHMHPLVTYVIAVTVQSFGSVVDNKCAQVQLHMFRVIKRAPEYYPSHTSETLQVTSKSVGRLPCAFTWHCVTAHTRDF